MALIGAPTLTGTVVQSFFIESLGGSQDPISYLDRFPDTVYNKSIDSLLVQFMYALLGPVGVGGLRQEYLEARLAVEQAGLQTTDLDSLYTNAFAFARLAEETYTLDADASLLPAAQRAQVLAQDAAFRNRAQDFLRGARAGGTLLGVTLAARSGLGQPCEAIENYRALYDHYTDIPLGLTQFGQTNQPNEVTIIPRQVTPTNDVQEIYFTGEPTRGWFTLTYPAGQSWNIIPVTCIATNAAVTVPTITQCPPGTFLTITNILTSAGTPALNPAVPLWNHGALYAQVGSVTGSTTVNLVQPLSGGSPGAAAPAPTSGTFFGFVGNAQSTQLPFNATAGEVQTALTALPVIGAGNVICSGGPLPDQPIQITFTGAMSDIDTPTIAVNTATDPAVGVGVGAVTILEDVVGDPLNIVPVSTTTTAGISLAQQESTIAPADEYAMRLAIDQIKPMTTFITTQPGQATTFQQTPNTTFIASSQIEIARYATGRNNIAWPSLDATHWIQSGVEHEAPLLYGASDSQYTGFHNISSVVAYTEGALNDVNYTSGEFTESQYWDTLIGNFSNAQLLLLPGLNSIQNAQMQFTPTGADAAQAEPLVITTVNGQGIINGSYPVDYLSLPGVQQPTGGTLWASMERPTGEDYLEIDLGHAQAVNFLYFQASSKPYAIDIAYDTLDQAPARNFRPATIPPHSQSVTNLIYNSTSLWTTVQISLTNELGGMIYTRFLRIGFLKQPAATPYAPIGLNTVPYSIEVQNLRLGRSVT